MDASKTVLCSKYMLSADGSVSVGSTYVLNSYKKLFMFINNNGNGS